MKQKQSSFAHRGLTLPRSLLRRLDRLGIFVQTQVSLEHQHLAGRYVVRGIESGGAVKEIGRYVTFCGPNGEPMPYLHPIDAIGVNGVHAVVVAPVLVRIELLRVGRTCQLLVTKHQPGHSEDGKRSPLENNVLFRGVDGFLGERAGKENQLNGLVMLRFWSRAGEEHEIPQAFAAAVQAAIKGASCIGCSHTHYLIAGGSTMSESDRAPMRTDSKSTISS